MMAPACSDSCTSPTLLTSRLGQQKLSSRASAPASTASIAEGAVRMMVWAKVRTAALVLAGPVYFMNISAQMKAVIDRHRAALHVTMKPDRIVCVPRVSTASRTAVLVFSQGEPQSPHWLDAARTLTRFVEEFYHGRVVATVVGAGLAMPGQVRWDARRLRRLAAAVGLPTDEAAVERMLHRNRRALEEADAAGRRLLSYLRPA